jgi:hypothetical protein
VAGQRAGGPVVAQHRHVEPADAGGVRLSRERLEQGAPNAAPLPAVDHLDRDFGGIEFRKAGVAGDPDRGSGRRREGDQRLVVPVVDAQQEAQLARGQLVLGAEVALVARLGTEVAEHERDGAAIAVSELPDRDLIPHR